MKHEIIAAIYGLTAAVIVVLMLFVLALKGCDSDNYRACLQKAERPTECESVHGWTWK